MEIIRGVGGDYNVNATLGVEVGQPHGGHEGDIRVNLVNGSPRLYIRASDIWYHANLASETNPNFMIGTSEDNTTITSTGLIITNSFTEVASIAQDTVITGGTITLQGTTGTTGDDKIVIGASNPIAIYANAAKVFDVSSTGKVNIGPAAVAGTAVTYNVRISDSSVYCYANHTGTYSLVNSSGLSVYVNGAGDSGLVARYGSNAIINGGTITLQGTTGTLGDDKLVIGSASLAMYADGDKILDIVDGKINIGPAAVAGTAVIGNVRVDGGSVYCYGDATNTFSQMSSAGLEVTDAGNKRAIFGATSVIGSSGAAVTTTSTDDCIRIQSGVITCFVSNTNKVTISGSGLKVYDDSSSLPSAQFGLTSYVGAVATEHIKIESGELSMNDGGVVMMSLADGSMSMKGKIIITSVATRNVCIGVDNPDVGTDNVYIGVRAGENDDSGAANNVFIGTDAGNANEDSDFNTAVGFEALKVYEGFSGTGYTTAVGYRAGEDCVEGIQNTFLGANAGRQVIGVGALGQGYNTCVGFNAGHTITTGSENTVIGDGSDVSAYSATNQTVIGKDATGIGNNTAVIGNAATTKVYMAEDQGASAWLEHINMLERSSDPTEPTEGHAVIWLSDGTGKGDDGDVLIASQAGGTTKYATIFNHSGGSSW